MKKKILNFINKFLEAKINVLRQELDSLHKDKNEITKSSAGDKFETGRSLIQIEIDKLDNQYLHVKNQIYSVNQTIAEEKEKICGFGSMVETEKALYYLSIGLGKHIIDKREVMLISLSSPIGKLLNGKRCGDNFTFNGKEDTIKKII
tara:strand:+ start:1279 stop:1722 length:444 start_codon:yes stop_codon:yes gene_type:complete